MLIQFKCKIREIIVICIFTFKNYGPVAAYNVFGSIKIRNAKILHLWIDSKEKELTLLPPGGEALQTKTIDNYLLKRSYIYYTYWYRANNESNYYCSVGVSRMENGRTTDIGWKEMIMGPVGDSVTVNFEDIFNMKWNDIATNAQ
jgi:hypothetical protein